MLAKRELINFRIELAPDQYDGPLVYDICDDGQRLAVIDDGELVLYDTEDGEILERKSLDQIFRDGDSAKVIRFAGPSLDLIVASENNLARIDADSLEFDASRSSVGEPIAVFTVSDQDEHLMIRTESGSIFAGDSQLDTLEKLKLGKDPTFRIASLSDDGNEIGCDRRRRCHHVQTRSIQSR